MLGILERNAHAKAEEWEAETGTRAPRIIVAEDDTELRTLIGSKLRTEGYEVVEVASGTRLADFLMDRNGLVDTDLILSDIRMPGLTGLEMLAYLRMRGDRLPIVLITAFGDWKTHEEADRLGATAVFDKPLDLDDLRDYLRGILFREGGDRVAAQE